MSDMVIIDGRRYRSRDAQRLGLLKTTEPDAAGAPQSAADDDSATTAQHKAVRAPSRRGRAAGGSGKGKAGEEQKPAGDEGEQKPADDDGEQKPAGDDGNAGD